MAHVLGGRGRATITFEVVQAGPEGEMEKTGWAGEPGEHPGVAVSATKWCHAS